MAGTFEELHHGHGTVVSGPNGDAVPVQNGAEIVRMHALDHERDQARLVRRRADDAQSLDRRERVRRVLEELLLVRVDGVAVERLHEVHGRAEPDDARDVRRAGLELVRQRVVHGLAEAHREDHVAPALPGRHALEQRLSAVEHAHARRSEHLVSREGIEVAAELLHVHLEVRHRLRAVDERRDAPCLGGGDEPAHGQDRAEGVRYVGEGE